MPRVLTYLFLSPRNATNLVPVLGLQLDGVDVQSGLVNGHHVPNLDRVVRLCIVLNINYLDISM